MDDPIKIQAMNGATYMMLQARKPDRKSVLLLHGWTGDETSMWTLASMFDTGGLIASVRGFHKAEPGGYSWVEEMGSGLSGMDAFAASAEKLDVVVRDIIVRTGMDRHQLVLAGFSQGAAMALAAAKYFSYKPAGVVAASGFLPEGDVSGLEEVQVFWGHGRNDDIIPITTARDGAARLASQGIEVAFCETDAGHKISHQCLRGLEDWIEALPVEEHHLHGD